MRKTFLKVALIGLLVGSLPVGFTSCKDYDDDINNLENQTSDLKTKLASVETAIAALPSKADVTAAQAAAVAQAKADLETVKAQLEAAIANKADKSEVEAINGELSKIQGQLETLDALKADVATALEAVTKVTELDAELQKQGQAIAGLTAQMETLTGSLATEAENLKNDIENNKTSIADMQKQLADLANKINGEGGDATPIQKALDVINGMITSIRLVNDWGAMKNDGDLKLYNPIVVENTPVGPNNTALPLFDLKKGDQKDFTDSVLVQVSPSGATLSQGQLTLVNSQLQEIKDYVVISKVRAYNEKNDLLSRAASSNGLYVVYFAQNPTYKWKEDEDQAKANKTQTNFLKATKTQEGKGSKIRFALALNEKNEGLGERDVMTPWDLTVQGGKVSSTWNLGFTVSDETQSKEVEKIHNRFIKADDNSSYMYLTSAVGKDAFYKMDAVYANAKAIVNYTAAEAQGYAPVGDFAWLGNKAANGAVFAYKGIEGSYNDDRSSEDYFKTDLGKDFTVTVANAKNIYGYYVALDIDRATESDQSEKAAWIKYADNIKNLGKLFKDGNITLNIGEETKMAPGDVIGFRVWAVNYDGTLVDPDGRAFYVQVGEVGQLTSGAVSAVITPMANDAAGYATWTNAATSNVEFLSWTTAENSVNVALQVKNDNTPLEEGSKVTPYLANKDAKVTVTFGGLNSQKLEATMGTGADYSTSATKLTVNAQNYANIFKNVKVTLSRDFVDNITYSGRFVITSVATGKVLQYVNFSFQKQITDQLLTVKPRAGVTDAAGVINIFAFAGSIDKGVEASIDNVFFDGNVAVSFGAGYAAALQITEGKDAENIWNGNNEVPAYYMNCDYTHGFNFIFKGVGNSEKDTPMWIVSEYSTTTNYNDANDPWCVISPAYNANDQVIKAATLNVINDKTRTRDLKVFKQYNIYSYDMKWVYDADGDVVYNQNTPEEIGNVARASWPVRVMTYPNTYTVSVPTLPSLKYEQDVVLAYEGIAVSSDWATKITNTPLPTVLGYANAAHTSVPNDWYFGIKEVNATTTPLVSLTGDIAQYFKPEVNAATIHVSVDPETGNVTTSGPSKTPVYGLTVKATTTAGKTTYAFANGKTDAQIATGNAVTLKAQSFVTAPTGNVTGNLTLKYFDVFGLGASFNANNKPVPYSTPSQTITMVP